MPHRGLRFDHAVAPNGYAWWYVDAVSDDGRHALTAIAFIGSVFSPYYAAARRRYTAAARAGDGVNPLNHCAVNVALYGERGSRWAMTERGSAQVEQQAFGLSIGPSNLRWRGDSIEMNIDELCAPLPRRIRGTLRVHPEIFQTEDFALEGAGLHRWTPYAPVARIEVNLQNPSISWAGIGYFDHNRGAAPLEDAFDEWTWSRTSLADRTVILYDTEPRAGASRALAMQFQAGREPQQMDPPRRVDLPRTGWGLPRHTRSEGSARLVKTLEDAPFYSRSQLDAEIKGIRAPAIHETLSLRRFRARWVHYLLPFRMPRITR